MTTWTEFSHSDHLNTSTWTFLILIVDKNRHFWITYPPLLVDVVVERPQRGPTATLHTGYSKSIKYFYLEK